MNGLLGIIGCKRFSFLYQLDFKFQKTLRTINRRVVQQIIIDEIYVIFNFQKPDKVIMIDSTDFEGSFRI
jgi:hypothetical protein